MVSGYRHDVNEICDLLGFSQRRVVVCYRHFGTAFEYGPNSCPKTSLRNYHSALRRIPKQRRSQVGQLLVIYSVSRLVVWFVGWLVGCLVGWLVGWFVRSFVRSLGWC